MQLSWTIAEQFRSVTSRHANATAIIDTTGPTSFAVLSRRAHALADYLSPLADAHRVGIYLPNRREWAETFFACQLAGVGVVPVNDRFQLQEVRHLVDDAGVGLLVSDGGAHRSDVLAALEGDVDTLLVGEAYERALRDATPRPRRTNNESAVIYTSGTTARPKGVRLTQANQLLGTFLGPSTLLGLTAADTVLVSTPLAHRVGQVRLLGGVLSGGRTILSADARPATLVDAVETHRVTVTGMVPTIARDLSAREGRLGERLASLRVLSVTGEAMTPDLRHRMAELLPHTELWTFFASTETGMVTALPPDEFTRRPASSGRALPGIEMTIDDGSPWSAGEGEILVRSGTPGSYAVGAGYVGHASEAPFVDDDGWFHTGDIGRLDDEGWLEITGRSKDMILSGGLNIAASEVENVLLRHPAVRDVAVTGEADARFGERVVAWVVVDPASGMSVTAAELTDFAGRLVASYKKPRVVHLVDRLPRTAAGKVAKWQLRTGQRHAVRGEGPT